MFEELEEIKQVVVSFKLTDANGDEVADCVTLPVRALVDAESRDVLIELIMPYLVQLLGYPCDELEIISIEEK